MSDLDLIRVQKMRFGWCARERRSSPTGYWHQYHYSITRNGAIDKAKRAQDKRENKATWERVDE